MQTFLSDLFIGLYFLTACFMMLYGLNCYVMVFLFLKGRKTATQTSKDGFKCKGSICIKKDMLYVTTQLPVFNEYNIAERVISVGKYLVGPFLVVYSLGFFSIGILTILHSIRFAK
jgi:hypothetical protein